MAKRTQEGLCIGRDWNGHISRVPYLESAEMESPVNRLFICTLMKIPMSDKV